MSGGQDFNELGAFANGSANFLSGDVARVVMYGAEQTAGEITTVFSTLTAEYLTSVGGPAPHYLRRGLGAGLSGALCGMGG